jgi:hypothetical protein
MSSRPFGPCAHDRELAGGARRVEASRALVTAALGGLLLAAPACGSSASDGVITSSTTDPSMTLEQFTKSCDARHGAVEIHSHCGGENSCKGMSYDTGNQVLTEHTCKGLNTCTGYSCVVPG